MLLCLVVFVCVFVFCVGFHRRFVFSNGVVGGCIMRVVLTLLLCLGSVVFQMGWCYIMRVVFNVFSYFVNYYVCFAFCVLLMWCWFLLPFVYQRFCCCCFKWGGVALCELF